VSNCLRLRKKKELLNGKDDELAVKIDRIAALWACNEANFQLNLYSTGAVKLDVCKYYKGTCLSLEAV